MPRSLPKVRFVYRRSSRYRGSTLLRADQMCRIAKAHLSDRYDFATLPIPGMRFAWQRAWWARRQEKAVFIFVKDAIDRLDRESLAALRKRSLGICLDYVDRDLFQLRPDSVDVHISCSIAGLEALDHLVAASTDADKPSGARARLLLHNTDERLLTLRFAPPDHARLVYFGGPSNTILTERARGMVDVISAELSEDMERNYRRIVDYNAHYCIRPVESALPIERVYKPFTKGFTAAVCGANVLVNEGVDDAVALLGKDYPFLVKAVDEGSIDAGLDAITNAYGTAEWRYGLEVMNGLKQRVAPATLAGDLKCILEELGV